MVMTSGECAVRIGSRVRVRDEHGDDEFTLVDEHEADAREHRVSTESPIGRALLGRCVGERVTFRAPGGTIGVTVVAVS